MKKRKTDISPFLKEFISSMRDRNSGSVLLSMSLHFTLMLSTLRSSCCNRADNPPKSLRCIAEEGKEIKEEKRGGNRGEEKKIEERKGKKKKVEERGERRRR